MAANLTYRLSTAVQGAMQRSQQTDDQCQEKFFSAKIRDCGKDQKQLFKLTSHLMVNTGHVILPIHESADQLATIFGDFYIDKAATIRRNINTSNPSEIHETALDDDVMFEGIPLQRFLPATHDEVKRIITNSPNKSCDLDPIPTWLLRQCLDHFVPLLTAIINKSYQNNYSTETALVKVQNDIAEALDQKRVVVLVMLDLSSAFDVINHGIILTRLQHSFGVTAEALDWMRSYISGKTQCVSVGPTTSFNARLCCGVPQGSVLGPKVYYIYTKPVGDIVKTHNLRYHCYADDTQIYLSIKPGLWKRATARFASCAN